MPCSKTRTRYVRWVMRKLRDLLRPLGIEDFIMMSERAHETRDDTDDADDVDKEVKKTAMRIPQMKI